MTEHVNRRSDDPMFDHLPDEDVLYTVQVHKERVLDRYEFAYREAQKIHERGLAELQRRGLVEKFRENLENAN